MGRLGDLAMNIYYLNFSDYVQTPGVFVRAKNLYDAVRLHEEWAETLIQSHEMPTLQHDDLDWSVITCGRELADGTIHWFLNSPTINRDTSDPVTRWDEVANWDEAPNIYCEE